MDPTLGGLVNTGLSGISGLVNAFQARSAFKHRYQDTVADMKAAGLNPALAYGQGGGNPQTNDIPDLGGSFQQGYSSAAEVQQRREQTRLTGAQADLLTAQRDDIVQGLQIRNRLASAQGMLAGQEWRFRGGSEPFTGTGSLQSQRDLLQQQLKNAVKTGELTQAQADKIATERGLLQLQFPEARANAAFFRGIGQWSPYLNAAGDVGRALNSFIPKITFGGDRSFNTHNWNPPGRR